MDYSILFRSTIFGLWITGCSLTKAARTALQNAASVASLMLTTECMVADIPEKSKGMPGMPPGGMDGMGEWT